MDVPHPLLHVMCLDYPRAAGHSLSDVVGAPASLPPATAAALVECKGSRDTFVSTYLAEQPLDPMRVLDVNKSWFPHCLGLLSTQASAVSAGTLPIGKEEFYWTSVLNKGPRSGQWTSPFVSFDAIFSSHAFCGAYINHANQLVRDGGVPNMVEASKQLRSAAGVYLYANEHIIPRLRSRGGTLHPPEVLPNMLLSLSAACIAQAQMCAVARAASDGMKAATQLKLVGGVIDKLEEAMLHIYNMPASDQELLDPHILGFLKCMDAISRGLAHKMAGEMAYEAEDYPHALSHMQLAKAKFDSLPGLVDMMPPGSNLDGVRAAHAEVNKLWAKYDDEGRTLFFAMPAKDTPLPPGSVIMKPFPYETPFPAAMPVRESGVMPSPGSPAASSGSGAGAGK